MAKKFFLGIVLSLIFFSAASAEEKMTVAVMDFGQHSGAVTSDLNADNIGSMSSQYIIQALSESGRFNVMSKKLVESQLAEKNISTTGIIKPSDAKKIGELLGVRYLVYGNVNGLDTGSVSLEVFSSGGTVHTVGARIAARVMDITDGSIVMTATGEGKSKSSKVKAGTDAVGFFTIGTKKVPQVSVHNAIQKAAYSMVDILIERLYGEKPKRKH